MSNIKWLISNCLHKRLIAILTIFQIVMSFISVYLAFVMKSLIDYGVDRKLLLFKKESFILIFCMFLQITLRTAYRYLNDLCLSATENDFKNNLLKKILNKNYQEVTFIHSEEWINRLTNDCAVISDQLTGIVPGFLGHLFKIISVLIALFFIDLRFLTIIAVCGAVLVSFTFVFRKQLKNLQHIIQEKDGLFRIYVREKLNSLLLLKLYDQTNDTLNKAEIRMDDHKKARIKRSFYSGVANFGFSLAINGAYVFAAIYFGYQILIGSLTFGSFTAVLQLISQIQNPIANISGYIPRYYSLIASTERLRIVESYNDDTPFMDIRKIEFEFISLENINFSYHDKIHENRVLSNFSLDINRGDKIAITGASGVGKSTLLLILMDYLKENSGKKIIKYNNEVFDLNNSYRGLFAYVPQTNGIGQGCIAESISLGSDYDRKRLRLAFEVSESLEFVENLPEKENTILNESGSGLSLGQLQRLSIARAIYSDRPILLLDEATSSINKELELKILDNITKLNKTVVMVTHHKDVLDYADKVIALD